MTNQRLKTLFLVGAFMLATIALTTALPTVSAAPDAAAIYTAKCAKCHGSAGAERYKKIGTYL